MNKRDHDYRMMVKHGLLCTPDGRVNIDRYPCLGKLALAHFARQKNKGADMVQDV